MKCFKHWEQGLPMSVFAQIEILDDERKGVLFTINWVDDGGGGLVPCLDMFNDSWFYFKEWPDLFQMLGTLEGDVEPDVVAKKLTELGFKEVESNGGEDV